jgi:polyisoprenoid-binding protein YceI
MKKTGLIAVAFALFAFTAFTTKGIWTSDVPHSEFGFSIVHMGISDVTGTFNDFTATVTSNKEDFSDAVVEASIQTASIDTRVSMRDDHLKSADFFEVEKFPTMTFKSTGIKKVGENTYKLTGNVTAKGITKEVILDMIYRGSVINPQTKKTSAGFKMTGTLKRSDFGIGDGFPEPMLSDEVKININAEVLQ